MKYDYTNTNYIFTNCIFLSFYIIYIIIYITFNNNNKYILIF